MQDKCVQQDTCAGRRTLNLICGIVPHNSGHVATLALFLFVIRMTTTLTVVRLMVYVVSDHNSVTVRVVSILGRIQFSFLKKLWWDRNDGLHKAERCGKLAPKVNETFPIFNPYSEDAYCCGKWGFLWREFNELCQLC
jgi:hypothetical protein